MSLVTNMMKMQKIFGQIFKFSFQSSNTQAKKRGAKLSKDKLLHKHENVCTDFT